MIIQKDIRIQKLFRRIKDIEQGLELVIYFNDTLNLVLCFLMVEEKKLLKIKIQFFDKIIWIF